MFTYLEPQGKKLGQGQEMSFAGCPFFAGSGGYSDRVVMFQLPGFYSTRQRGPLERTVIFRPFFRFHVGFPEGFMIESAAKGPLCYGNPDLPKDILRVLACF